jgi:hypothetical protein
MHAALPALGVIGFPRNPALPVLGSDEETGTAEQVAEEFS